MKRIACVFIFAALLSSSCTKKQPMPDPLCKAVFKATGAAATLIATTLQCANAGAIAADLSEPILKMGLCAESAAQSTLTDLVCPQISTFISSLVSGAVPSAWQCSTTIVSDIIKTQIQETCVKVVK